MEKMYQTYKDIAEFRLVYIKEAHALDSSWPVEYAKEMGIKQHKNYGERCSVAKKLLSDKNLTIPTLADDMQDTANKAYRGWPDRIFLVRKDGTLAIAAKRGPWGYKPGIKAANAWLASYKETGKEPPITKESADAGASGEHRQPSKKFFKIDAKAAATAVGSWQMKTEFGGNAIPAVMSIRFEDGHLVGVWASQGMEMKMAEVSLAGDTLKFVRSMGAGGPSLAFEGKITGDEIAGEYKTDFGKLKSNGKRDVKPS